jgi:hypothetical protein
MRLAAGIVLAALGLVLVLPVATVRMEQQVDRRQMIANLARGRVWEVIEIEAPWLTALDLAITSRNRPAPSAEVRVSERPGGVERMRQPLPRRLPPPGTHEYTSFRFPALRDSGGRAYEVSIERLGPPPEGELVVWGRVSQAATGRLESAFAYRAWHRVTGWSALGRLGERIGAAPLGVAGVAGAVVLVLAYGASLVRFLGLLRARPG